MMNTLMTVATVFFIAAAVDHGYRTSRSLYWDFTDFLNNRRWKREAALRKEEMDKALAVDAVTPVAL